MTACSSCAHPQVINERVGRLPGVASGWKFRVKSATSIYAKMFKKLSEQRKVKGHCDQGCIEAAAADVAGKMKDVLRYTKVFPAEVYAESVREVVQNLVDDSEYSIDVDNSAGANEVRFKNYWLAGDYNGINMNVNFTLGPDSEGEAGAAAVLLSDSIIFELQFATLESAAAKEKSHLLYDEERVTTNATLKLELQQQTRKLWAGVPTPPGVLNLHENHLLGEVCTSSAAACDCNVHNSCGRDWARPRNKTTTANASNSNGLAPDASNRYHELPPPPPPPTAQKKEALRLQAKLQLERQRLHRGADRPLEDYLEGLSEIERQVVLAKAEIEMVSRCGFLALKSLNRVHLTRTSTDTAIQCNRAGEASPLQDVVLDGAPQPAQVPQAPNEQDRPG